MERRSFQSATEMRSANGFVREPKTISLLYSRRSGFSGLFAISRPRAAVLRTAGKIDGVCGGVRYAASRLHRAGSIIGNFDKQLAEIGASQKPNKGLRRVLEPLDDVFFIFE